MNINRVMLHSIQETKYDFLLLLLLPLVQPTLMTFKQQQQQQKHSSGMRVSPRRDKLHFIDLQYICIYIYASHTYAAVN